MRDDKELNQSNKNGQTGKLKSLILWVTSLELRQILIGKADSDLNVIEGKQNMPSQSMPLWRIDYFELKLLKEQLV